jgi:hypothetical protein
MMDKTTRCLSAIGTASSNRVLNLNTIGQRHKDDPAHSAMPLFRSQLINSAIILKHTLRPDEVDDFIQQRAVATKIIIPFERNNLRSGGRSMFVDQRDFEQLLSEIGNYRRTEDLSYDLFVLRLIDAIPSLDPFLLREKLRINEVKANGSYFEISAADQKRMFAYAAREISRLTVLVNKGPKSIAAASTAKMVAALLSNEVSEKLEPMRATLGLNHGAFAEGVFSWRGFIYYKWSLNEFCPNLIKLLREIKSVSPCQRMSHDQRIYFDESKASIIRGIKSNVDKAGDIISVYDDAYDGLIERHDPKLFRDFLLAAPSLFLEIGERMGVLSHINSFWAYRFPPGSAKHAEVEELISIFEDFLRGLHREDEDLMVSAA